jgi:prepilin-type N-terminal cleavage/methylation domain-containing protein
MWKSLKQIGRKVLNRNGRGATLIEVLIALTILGFMVGYGPPVMAAVVNTQFRVNELNIAQDLTRSQFEYIKAQHYNGNLSLGSELYQKVPRPSGYEMNVVYDSIDPTTGTVPPTPPDGIRVDTGIERVKITVYGWRYDPNQNLYMIMQTTNYKVSSSLQISGYEVNPTHT